MAAIKQHLSLCRTDPAAARAVLAGLLTTTTQRGNARKALVRAGFTPQEVAALVPAGVPGRPGKVGGGVATRASAKSAAPPPPTRKGKEPAAQPNGSRIVLPAPERGAWKATYPADTPMGKSIRDISNERFGIIRDSGILTSLGDKNAPAIASALADELIAGAALTSKTAYLAQLRNLLKYHGAPHAVIDATKRPDITAAKNARSDARWEEFAEEGLDMPERWSGPIAEVRQAIIDSVGVLTEHNLKHADPDALAPHLLDLYVGAAVRPGELGSLSITAEDMVEGMLKKRGDAKPMPYTALLPVPVLRPILAAYAALPAGRVKALRSAATKAVKALGRMNTGKPTNQLRWLRTLGAELAVDWTAGEHATDAARRRHRGVALRHERAPVGSVDHYATVRRRIAVRKNEELVPNDVVDLLRMLADRVTELQLGRHVRR